MVRLAPKIRNLSSRTDIPEGAKRWQATEKPERYAAEGVAEGAECRRTTEKPVILGGRFVALRCYSLPPFCMTVKREIEGYGSI